MCVSCFCRAHAGDKNGSVYLQAFAKYLQEEYMKRPLDKILKMVRQSMIGKVQVRARYFKTSPPLSPARRALTSDWLPTARKGNVSKVSVCSQRVRYLWSHVLSMGRVSGG